MVLLTFSNTNLFQLCSDNSAECVCKKKCYPNYVKRVSPCACLSVEKPKQTPTERESSSLITESSKVLTTAFLTQYDFKKLTDINILTLAVCIFGCNNASALVLHKMLLQWSYFLFCFARLGSWNLLVFFFFIHHFFTWDSVTFNLASRLILKINYFLSLKCLRSSN